MGFELESSPNRDNPSVTRVHSPWFLQEIDYIPSVKQILFYFILFFFVKHLTKLSTTHKLRRGFKEEYICHVAAREWISTLPQLSSLATYSQKPEAPPDTFAQRFETSLKLHFRSQSLWPPSQARRSSSLTPVFK